MKSDDMMEALRKKLEASMDFSDFPKAGSKKEEREFDDFLLKKFLTKAKYKEWKKTEKLHDKIFKDIPF